jgi:hypothetical protein
MDGEIGVSSMACNDSTNRINNKAINPNATIVRNAENSPIGDPLNCVTDFLP